MTIVEISVGFLRGLHLTALMSLFGTLLFLVVLGRAAFNEAGEDAEPVRRALLLVARISAGGALIVALAWLIAETCAMAGCDSVADAMQALPAVMFQTRFGKILVMRSVLLLALLPLLRPRQGSLIAAWALSLATLALQPLLGHAGAIGGSAGADLVACEALHLSAAGAWLGSLIPLFLCIRMMPQKAAATACRTFALVGVGAVVILGSTAALLFGTFVGSPGGLAATEYGHLAATKIFIFVLLLSLAALNRFVLTHRLAHATPGSARFAMCSTISIEALLGAAVIVAAAFLASVLAGEACARDVASRLTDRVSTRDRIGTMPRDAGPIWTLATRLFVDNVPCGPKPERIQSTDMSHAVLIRVFACVIAAAVFGASVMQPLPGAAMPASVHMHMHMAAMDGNSDAPPMPCKHMAPACMTDLGCVLMIGLPAFSAQILVPMRWLQVDYRWASLAPADSHIGAPALRPPDAVI